MSLPFYLVGPTAVGKSSLATDIAERCGAEIVGADAFQVYQGLDVLTAKPSVAQLRRVPHHLVGSSPLDTEYNVARYLEDARRCLAEIASRGKPVIIVGGTGLYVRALTHGLSPLPPAQPELRDELERLELPELVARLRRADPLAVESIDIQNRRRLVRAIEICETSGEALSAVRSRWQEADPPPGAANGLLLIRDRAELNARITSRTQNMVADGLLAEVAAVKDEDLSPTSSKIIGLAEVQAHLRGEISLEACLSRIEVATRQYAKRQMTWFRGKSGFRTFNLSQDNEQAVVDEAIDIINTVVA